MTRSRLFCDAAVIARPARHLSLWLYPSEKTLPNTGPHVAPVRGASVGAHSHFDVSRILETWKCLKSFKPSEELKVKKKQLTIREFLNGRRWSGKHSNWEVSFAHKPSAVPTTSQAKSRQFTITPFLLIRAATSGRRCQQAISRKPPG